MQKIECLMTVYKMDVVALQLRCPIRRRWEPDIYGSRNVIHRMCDEFYFR